MTGFFYNPNIQPFIEFRRRLKAMKVMQERVPISVIYDEEYGLREYLEEVDWRSGARCADCYRVRMRRTAAEAARRGFDAITTTLLGSTRQDHDLIRRVAQEAADGSGVQFLYRDWRPLAESGHERAGQMHLYLQNYCGCIFSEWERFRDGTLHVYRGSGPAARPEQG